MSEAVQRTDRSFFGRGKLDAPTPRCDHPPSVKTSRQGEFSQLSGFLNRSVTRWFKQLRRIQSFSHAASSSRAAETAVSRVQLWNSIRNAHGFEGGFEVWWVHRPIRSQAAPMFLPRYAPGADTAKAILEDFHQNYRKFEAWQMQRRQDSCRSKLLQSTKGLFHATRKTPSDALDCLEDHVSQTIQVVDTRQNLVSVPNPFPEEAVIAWTLQHEPARVVPVGDLYKVDSDFLLASGQELSCRVLVHEVETIHSRLEALWTARWLKHTNIAPDRWDPIIDFAQEHLQQSPLQLPPISAQDWHRAVHRFKTTAATGPCGWALQDLQHFTDLHVQQVLDLYSAIENGMPWPKQLNTGLIFCLQKRADSTTVEGYRPITVTSLFYRIWAGIRAGQILSHLALSADSFQVGFMKHRQASDVWYFINTCLEISLMHSRPVHGITADLVKAYNTLARSPAFAFLKVLGIPSWFLDVWANYLVTFTRHFVVRHVVSDGILSSTGFPEGCPLSCCAMAAYNHVWHAWQTRVNTRSLSLSYVDNLEIVVDSIPDLLEAVDGLFDFCRQLDLSVDMKSFYAWSSSAEGCQALRDHGFPVNLSARDLGGQVTYCAQLRNRVLVDRVNAALPFFSKLRAARLPIIAKQMNVKQVLWPRALHGCEAVTLGDQHIKRLRSGTMKSLHWDQAGATPFVRISLLASDLDPAWYQLWRVFLAFRSNCRQNPVIRDWWKLFLQGIHHAETFGPFGKLRQLVHELGLELNEEGHLFFSEHGFVDVWTCSEPLLRMVLSHFFHQHMSRELHARKGFEDLHGCDVELTSWEDRNFSVATQAKLMKVRDGSFFTGVGKSKFDTTKSADCSWCNVPDTVDHRYTVCSKYEAIRGRHLELFGLWETLPYSFRRFGLVPANPWKILTWEALQALPDRLQVYQFAPFGEDLHICTDGTCSSPECQSEALAAWATVVADQGILSWGPLHGMQQTILRAELSAVLSALLWVKCWGGTLNIWSDNQTVVDHLRDILRGRAHWQEWERGDLWHQVADAVMTTPATLVIHKVASHIGQEDCSSALEDFAKKWNDSADRQAACANISRPPFFNRVWARYQSFRAHWKKRVILLTHFQAEIADKDCEEMTHDDSEHEESFVSLLGFERRPNVCEVCVQLAGTFEGQDHFGSHHDANFRTVATSLVHWMVQQDREASEMRLVSLIEIYVGFRLFGYERCLLSTGARSGESLSSLTFAADFRYFRDCFRWLFSLAEIPWKTGMANLSEVNIFVPQPGIWLGWTNGVEDTVLSALLAFVGQRPIRTAQGFAKPWHI